jgi:hypothetical protein
MLHQASTASLDKHFQTCDVRKRTKTQMTTQNRAVLFIDILGFATLTEQNLLDFETIRRRQNVLTIFEEAFGKPNPLTHAFTRFHHTMKWAIEHAQMEHPLTAITFSDSAFIATMSLSECVAIAIYVMQSLLRSRVPVRAGIALGSFSTIRFKSDIIGEWGDHSSHFLGTGVVRSSAAERCGVNGLRILLHPTAAALVQRSSGGFSNKPNITAISCSPDEIANPANSSGVQYEIDYWQFKPTAEADAWRALQDMWDSAPQCETRHYEATAQAINRMRVSRDEPPVENLRRRALPKRRKSS